MSTEQKFNRVNQINIRMSEMKREFDRIDLRYNDEYQNLLAERRTLNTDLKFYTLIK